MFGFYLLKESLYDVIFALNLYFKKSNEDNSNMVRINFFLSERIAIVGNEFLGAITC